MNLHLVKSYLNYQLKARYRKGYGLHSPMVFQLVRELIYGKKYYSAFDSIKTYRQQLSKSSITIQTTDYGSGSNYFTTAQRKVSQLNNNSSISDKYGVILFKLVEHFKPKTIIELGTSIGISTAYLAKPSSKTTVYTIEACEATADFATNTLKELECTGVKQLVGQFRDVLPNLVGKIDKLDFVFFDGHHDRKATLDYFNMCLLKAHNDTIFVFDDIHWSKGMTEAWNIIYKHPDITVSIDLFQLGIVFFNKKCQKQHFIVRY